jgi:hypothetical protein
MFHATLNSSWVRTASYIPSTQTLYLELGDRIYSYFDVPLYIYLDLLRTSAHNRSVGKFYNAVIKPLSSSQRLDVP